jgi:DNA mismatch repair ATPase MutS
VAVNHILAQTIHTCTARAYALRPSYVCSSMAIKDDILAGESYFIAEIKSLKRVIAYAKQRPCICLIDEILRGTNTPERIAASTAVLRALHETDSLCLIASHDIELTDILKDLYDNYHFRESFIDGEITFDYQLHEGPSTTTNAIKLLAYMGFEKEIVAEAARRVKS